MAPTVREVVRPMVALLTLILVAALSTSAPVMGQDEPVSEEHGADATHREASSGARSDIRSEHGPPDAFAILFYEETPVDGDSRTVRVEEWTYYDQGLEFSFTGEGLISREPVEVPPGQIADPAPYDPDVFEAFMSLDELVTATGLPDYIGGPVKDLVKGGDLYFGDRLIWGMKDDELVYVEALALEAEESAGSQP